ncbi:hypothetical protein F5Y16DRAFT_119224 [Xylariaceae sp. FL0255]|nr:hypothetical protein F5Y16DRAFT_119224 [Xylariaceae sp. FL0255]
MELRKLLSVTKAFRVWSFMATTDLTRTRTKERYPIRSQEVRPCNKKTRWNGQLEVQGKGGFRRYGFHRFGKSICDAQFPLHFLLFPCITSFFFHFFMVCTLAPISFPSLPGYLILREVCQQLRVCRVLAHGGFYILPSPTIYTCLYRDRSESTYLTTIDNILS